MQFFRLLGVYAHYVGIRRNLAVAYVGNYNRTCLMEEALTGTNPSFASDDSVLEKMSVFLALSACFALACSHLEKPELLSELPIEKLLQARKSILSELGSCNASRPTAAALVRPLEHMQIREGPIDRGHYEEEEEEEEEEEWEWMSMAKGKGIGQIFDTSVTALAFLAFGGYLVCLIIHAIKKKDEDEEEEVMQLQQLLLNQQRPGMGSIPLVNLRPGRRRRDLMAVDPVLMQLVDTGYLFAEALLRNNKNN